MRKVIFIFALLIAPLTALGAGGACPAGANYTNPANPAGSLVTLASLGITSCYYISSTGSEANSGLSEGSPKRFLPGMAGATITPAAGEGFIIQGGSVYHFGNSGASPYTGGTWSWVWNGTSTNPYYIGVDPAWFSGGSWARPILTADNPVSTSTTLSGCSYQSGTYNIMFSLVEQSYLMLDNVEMTGMCQGSTLTGAGANIYITDNSSQYFILENSYLHGATHKQFACSLSGGEPVGMCFSATMIRGSDGSRVETGVQYLFDVFDNSDGDIAGWAQIYDPAPTVAYSVFNGGSQVITQLTHLWHDNLMQNWVDPGDGIAHGNLWESVGDQPGVDAIYNNVWTLAYQTGIQGVCFWPNSMSSTNMYIFNNLWFNINCGSNFINATQNSGPQNQITFFNNTLENPQNGPMLTCVASPVYAAPWAVVNNHYVTDSSSPYMSGCTSPLVINLTQTELRQSHATATAAGESSTFPAWSPTLGSDLTVNAGTNKTSTYCAALATAASSDPTLAGAAAACASDTGYACSYVTANHTVSCPARPTVARPSSGPWYIGAYNTYVAGLPTANLACSPGSGPYSSVSITCSSSTPASSIYYTLTGIAPTCASTLYTGPLSPGLPVTFEAIACAGGYLNSGVFTGSYTLMTSAPYGLTMIMR